METNCGLVSVATALNQYLLTCAGEALAAMLVSAVLVKTNQLSGQTQDFLGSLRSVSHGIKGDYHGRSYSKPLDAEEDDGDDDDDDEGEGGFGEGEEDLSSEDDGDVGNNPPNNNKSNSKKGGPGGAGGAEENGEEEDDDEEDGDDISHSVQRFYSLKFLCMNNGFSPASEQQNPSNKTMPCNDLSPTNQMILRSPKHNTKLEEDISGVLSFSFTALNVPPVSAPRPIAFCQLKLADDSKIIRIIF